MIAGSEAPRAVDAREGRVQSEPDADRTPKRLRWSETARNAALREAAFWRPAGSNAASLSTTPNSANPLECRFKADRPGGTTPKFECGTPDGETVKVKYANAEPHAEVAASRLLLALGFPADDVRFVERLRCYGCPAFPFLTMKVLGIVNAHEGYGRTLDYDQYRDFSWVAVERKHEGTEIETPSGRGWAWFELRRLKAPPAHVDALRLLAVFLAHWDNKAENQRLACLDAEPGRERCLEPVALIQDLGGTFGPRKVNLERWRNTPVWADRKSCLLSMANMPHGGSTFQPVRIGDAGRRFLAERLAALKGAEVRGLFEAARFSEHDGRPVEEWVAAFEGKVRAVSEGPPCPAP